MREEEKKSKRENLNKLNQIILPGKHSASIIYILWIGMNEQNCTLMYQWYVLSI